MRSSYDRSLTRLLAHEGGYCNVPEDPGGPTNFGITIFDYRKYVKPNATADDVKNMPLATAKTIYRTKYWVTPSYDCDALPAGVDDCLLDYGVNSGVARAAKVARAVVGLPATARAADLEAAMKARDPKAVINAICDERQAFLESIKTFPTFGKGWTRRVKEVRSFDMGLASAAPVDVPVQAPAQTKAAHPKPSSTGPLSGGAVAAGGAATGLNHTTAIIVIVVICVAVGVLIYFINKRHKAKQETPMPVTVVPAQ